MSNQTYHACYHCVDRVVGCHVNCELYKKEQEERQQVKEERRKRNGYYRATQSARCKYHSAAILQKSSNKK